MKWLILAAAVCFNALANILIKAGMAGGDKQAGLLEMLKTRWLSLPIIGGIACFIIALAAYSYVLSVMNLNIAYPIMTTAGFMLIVAVSVLYFHETIVFTQIIGIALMIAGIWLVSR